MTCNNAVSAVRPVMVSLVGDFLHLIACRRCGVGNELHAVIILARPIYGLLVVAALPVLHQMHQPRIRQRLAVTS